MAGVGTARAAKAYQKKWERQFTWLRYDGLKMWCDSCTRASARGFKPHQRNSFVQGRGCTNFRLSTLERHQGGNTSDHNRLCVLLKSYPADAFARANARQAQRDANKFDVGVVTAFHTIFHLASKERPLSHYEDDIRFLAFKEEDGAKALLYTQGMETKVKYSHHESCTKILNSIASVMESDIYRQMRAGPYAIIIDESTDISTFKTLALCGRYFNDENRAVTKFLANLRLEQGDAKSIVEVIGQFLRSKELDPIKNVGLASDGASVMMGRQGGVGKRLRDGDGDRDAGAGPCPYMTHIHCMAHRLNLCSSQAAKGVFTDVQETISMVYRFFKHSTERTSKLIEIESMLEGCPTLKLKEPMEVRWLSLDDAVHTMFRVWNGVALALESEAANPKVPKAKGILHKVITWRFVAALALFRDILPAVSDLSRRFQSDSLTCSQADGFLNICKGRIRELQEGLGRTEAGVTEGTVKATDEDGKEIWRYRDVLLTEVSPTHQQRFQNDRKKFLKTLQDNISTRFPEEARSMLKNFDIFSKESDLGGEAGMKSIQELADFYGGNHDGTTEPLIDAEVAKTEWRDVCHLLPTIDGTDLPEVKKAFLDSYADEFPNVATLIKISQVIPLASVSCERAFSTQNRIKSKFRSRLGANTLQALMVVASSKDTLLSFNFREAIRRWNIRNADQ